jgi:hypothetical protein
MKIFKAWYKPPAPEKYGSIGEAMGYFLQPDYLPRRAVLSKADRAVLSKASAILCRLTDEMDESMSETHDFFYVASTLAYGYIDEILEETNRLPPASRYIPLEI